MIGQIFPHWLYLHAALLPGDVKEQLEEASEGGPVARHPREIIASAASTRDYLPS